MQKLHNECSCTCTWSAFMAVHRDKFTLTFTFTDNFVSVSWTAVLKNPLMHLWNAVVFIMTFILCQKQVPKTHIRTDQVSEIVSETSNRQRRGNWSRCLTRTHWLLKTHTFIWTTRRVWTKSNRTLLQSELKKKIVNKKKSVCIITYILLTPSVFGNKIIHSIVV